MTPERLAFEQFLDWELIPGDLRMGRMTHGVWVYDDPVVQRMWRCWHHGRIYGERLR